MWLFFARGTRVNARLPRWLGAGTALLVCGCARPTLEEEERKLQWGDARPHTGEQDAGTTLPKQPDASHQTVPDAGNHAPSSGHHDAGSRPVPPPDSATTPTPVIDAGHSEPDATTPPPQDAGSTTPTNPPGCPTSEPSTFTGKPCFNFTSTCTYGSTECHCGAVLWVCK